MADRHQLTDLQIAILRLLWARGEMTVIEIWEALHPERGLAQTTVATLLSRLQRRGVLSRQTDDRQYRYRAMVTEEEVQLSMVEELTERLFQGDVPSLVNHLLTSQEMSPGDLDRVRRMIDEFDRTRGESR
ncbi:MAG: BlaI/MecI/CopY family transcriptional regulator [Gemmatimonadota bacterium]